MKLIDADALLHIALYNEQTEEDDYIEKSIEDVLDTFTLEGCPPAQPETHEKRTETHACGCISRQAAIDEIMGQPPEPHYPSWYAEQIKALPPAQPEWKWTPVSERLPEESGYCIITAHDGVGHRTTFAKFQKKAKSWDLTGARSYWRVIAWMPMPEPYKEDKE